MYEVVAAEITVKGRVQGVGFRFFAFTESQRNWFKWLC